MIGSARGKMFTFGKMRSGHKNIVRTRRFDTLIGVGQRVVSDRCDPFENEAFMRSLRAGETKKVAHPKRSGVEVHMIEREFSDEGPDLVFAYQPYGGRIVYGDQVSKRKWKKLNRRHDGDVPTWMMRKTDIKKVDRYTMKESLGNLFLEPDPDGKDRIARYKIREQRIVKGEIRQQRSWKRSALKSIRPVSLWFENSEKMAKLTGQQDMKLSFGNELNGCKARKAWATKFNLPRHKKIGMRQAMAESYIVYLCENEEWERAYAEMVSREIERDQEFIDDLWRIEDWRVEELEERYWYGDWNHWVKSSPRRQTEDDFDGLDEEAWAWNQAAA